MGFFPLDDVADEEHPPEAPRPAWWGPPDDEIPVAWAHPAVLGVSDHVAVALLGADVFRSGIDLRIERRLRRHSMSRGDWARHREAFLGRESEDTPGRLRYGVVLSNGQRVLDGAHHGPTEDPFTEPRSSVLIRSGGGGGGDDRSYSTTEGLWLWPLPPQGPLDLVFQWPDLGLPEAHVRLDGTAIVALSGRATCMWPDRPAASPR
ncbi:hypothetical protein [Tersicoccus sp. Bi-70]|uniref:hypothetical protein n=1 Tax=Tersicoccus sp. Bi-70 TaxID=1897634 RepID=UPI000976D7B0|nr:hypothetical protein [Tersicoccus sp. Bi-70]OMH34815.1 hypothetical protein BGP79_00060 [Tersicoccus sp. Bi-70]